MVTKAVAPKKIKRLKRVAVENVSDDDVGKEVGVAAVDRALSILGAFTVNDTSLSLHEIAARTGLYKSTILRLVSSLERQACMHRLDDGRYQLGPMVLHWSRVYNSSLRIENHVIPVLSQLVQETGEGASFFVREGNVRVCLFRVNAQRAIQEYVQVGDLLPLERGAAGRILLDLLPHRSPGPACPRHRSTSHSGRQTLKSRPSPYPCLVLWILFGDHSRFRDLGTGSRRMS